MRMVPGEKMIWAATYSAVLADCGSVQSAVIAATRAVENLGTWLDAGNRFGREVDGDGQYGVECVRDMLGKA